MHESRYHELNVFITLTYSDTFVPINTGLNPLHTQNFLKRLRKHHEPNALRFFLCGEYGEETNRPHYHAILFGIDFADKKKHSTNERGDQRWTSEKLEKIWGMGRCELGTVTPQSAGYVARYCMKKINGELAPDHYQGKHPEFARMSRRPGIGKQHYDQYSNEIFHRGFIVNNGKQAKIPSFYDRQLDKENPELLNRVKRERQKQALTRKIDSTPERLKVRESVKQAQITQLKRKN